MSCHEDVAGDPMESFTMRFNKLDLNLLVALDALLLERSITLAAQRVHLTPSAMSSALARCRDHFGDALLVQVGRRMEPTARALALHAGVRELLIRAQVLLQTEPVFDPARARRRFSLLLSDYNNALLAPELVRLAEREAPEVTFEFLPQQPGQPPQLMLERSETDLLLIADSLCSGDHPKEVILDDHFVYIACTTHPTIQGTLSLEQFQAAGHVIMSHGPALQSVESSALQRLGIERRAAVQTFDFLSIPAMVQGTQRIATVHHRVVQVAMRRAAMTLQQLTPPMPIPPVRIAMQWHAHRDGDPGLVWLRAMVRQAASALAEQDAVDA